MSYIYIFNLTSKRDKTECIQGYGIKTISINYKLSCSGYWVPPCSSQQTTRPLFPSLDEFGEFISDLVMHSEKILVIGDFNIYLNMASVPPSKAFLALIDTLGFTQFVHEPTHSSAITLDLILSGGIEVSDLNVSSVSSAVSDHFLIKFEVSLACPHITDTDVSNHLSHWPGNFEYTWGEIVYGPGSCHESDRDWEKFHQ